MNRTPTRHRGPVPLTSPPVGPMHLLTVAEVMARLKVSRRTVYNLIGRRKLPSVTIGRCRRIPVSSLDTYVTDLLEGRTI